MTLLIFAKKPADIDAAEGIAPEWMLLFAEGWNEVEGSAAVNANVVLFALLQVPQ